ncbi:Uncharacterized conserved protein YtfP, gamma-glutamylcyclotransferase (GGCT)/AIG2-like family [Marininema mesophilum]|uniref:Uncharacterized conserved protein YtfP, gamma-glutamylcyclotransferase (GGCT)/AIG2-like family n=1 Tax=Marininema mesophilum TaxID=1048340 RepID=A0A1H3B9G4_9BACL|nr:gamma-glutamylcyclotransferase family protein [Marininema mesophilum]SDX38577.1 Uncharacterized conserved protein YtfP, gamma-glutamylcyclotransferase (GGCT)/AIG2-like family [Marininema mesophilum]
MEQKKTLLFVYGSLRKGEEVDHYLKDAEPVALQAWIEGTLVDMGGKYPGLILSSNKRVYGEVYRVTEEQLTIVDQWEDYLPGREDNLFERKVVKVGTDRGEVEAEVYVYARPSEKWMKAIPSGDWRSRLLRGNEFLYFAYGSCMDDERFTTQGVADEFLSMEGCGVLKGYAMRYTLPFADGGRADIVEDDDIVEGKVYRINGKGLEYLLWREGVQQQTYRPVWLPIQLNGELVSDVLSFTVVDKQEEVAPPEHYAREILRGAKGTVTEAYHERLRRDLEQKFAMNVSID